MPFNERLDTYLTGCLIAPVKDQRGCRIPLRDRRRYRAALIVICDYLRAIGVSTVAVNELLELAQALDELGKGTTRPFLRAAKTASKVDPGDVWRARAYVAIAATILAHLPNMTRKATCERLAKDYEFLRTYIVAKNARSFEGAIRSWLDRFEAGNIRHRVAQEIFDRRDDIVRRWGRGKSWSNPDLMLSRKAMAEACGAAGCMLKPEALAAFRIGGRSTLSPLRS